MNLDDMINEVIDHAASSWPEQGKRLAAEVAKFHVQIKQDAAAGQDVTQNTQHLRSQVWDLYAAMAGNQANVMYVLERIANRIWDEIRDRYSIGSILGGIV